MIRSFGDKATAAVFERRYVRALPHDIQRVGFRKLVQLHSAKSLDDLRAPAGNRLETLKGDRSGQHSIRVNDQWRICFTWKDGDAWEVEIVDYH